MAADDDMIYCDGPYCLPRKLTYRKEECERVRLTEGNKMFEDEWFCVNCFRHVQWVGCCHVCNVWIEQHMGGKDLPTYIKHMGHLYCEDCLCDTTLIDNDVYHINHDPDEDDIKKKTLKAYKKGDRGHKVVLNIEKIIQYAKNTHELMKEIEKDPRKQRIQEGTAVVWKTSLEQCKWILKMTEEQLDALSSDSICCMQSFLIKLIELK